MSPLIRLLSLCLTALLLLAPLTAQALRPFEDSSLPIDKRIDNLLSLMTLDEKIAAFGTQGVNVPRLGVKGPSIGEALQGVVYGGPMATLLSAIPGAPVDSVPKNVSTTQFPQGAGLGRSWDPTLVRRVGAAIGLEARHIWENGRTDKPFLVLLTPNADLARDPRWGRTQETYGEDPLLAGRLAAAMSRGVQGDAAHWQAASLVKHFLANSNEANRYGSTSDFDETLLREYYAESFRRAFVDGGAKSFMASYNAWNKLPLTVHPLLRELAMKEYGVDGIICTDAGSLINLVQAHKTHAGMPEAVTSSVKAGINMFLTIMENGTEGLQKALAAKALTEADLDNVLRGSLRVSFRLGILDKVSPFAALKGTPDPAASATHKALALEAARKSIVLLKNEGLLPLDAKALKSVAVIGPLADVVLPDFYGGQPPYTVTVLSALKEKLGPGVKVTYTAGEGAAAVARAADLAIVVTGNHATCGRNPQQLLGGLMANVACTTPGENMEGADRLSLDLNGEPLVKEVFAANPKTVLVLVSSAPYAITWPQANLPAILHGSHNGQELGHAVAEALLGEWNPSGRLVQTWVKSVDQLPTMLDYDLRHGRTYMYFQKDALYPFGFGLSYTKFNYAKLRVEGRRARLEVTNSGARDGDEVVQVYAQYPAGTAGRPLKRLLGFERVSLKKGETKTVTVELEAPRWWDAAAKRFVGETGPVAVFAGGSSMDVRLKAELRP